MALLALLVKKKKFTVISQEQSQQETNTLCLQIHYVTNALCLNTFIILKRPFKNYIDII